MKTVDTQCPTCSQKVRVTHSHQTGNVEVRCSKNHRSLFKLKSQILTSLPIKRHGKSNQKLTKIT
jgi:DNA-directed RNA polymerase subunit RPC12/RpoP